MVWQLLYDALSRGIQFLFPISYCVYIVVGSNLM